MTDFSTPPPGSAGGLAAPAAAIFTDSLAPWADDPRVSRVDPATPLTAEQLAGLARVVIAFEHIGESTAMWTAAGRHMEMVKALAPYVAVSAVSVPMGTLPYRSADDVLAAAGPLPKRPPVAAYDAAQRALQTTERRGSVDNTDAGRGARLAAWVEATGGRYRYVLDSGRWAFFDGARWVPDTGELHIRRAAEGRTLNDDPETAVFSRSETGIRNAVSAAARQPGMAVMEADFDADPYSLNCDAGIINLRTGELSPHTPGAMHSMLAPAGYVPTEDGRESLEMLEMLGVTFERNPQTITAIQTLLGSMLVGAVVEEQMVLAYGGGQNGKTTLVDLLDAILGDYVVHLGPEVLTGKASPRDFAELKGRRILFIEETAQGATLDETAFKRLASRGTLTGARLYERQFSFTPSHSTWLSTNHKPVVRSTDHGTWRRLFPLEFPHRVTDAEKAEAQARFMERTTPEQRAQDPEGRQGIAGLLYATRANVLGWLVGGAMTYLADGLFVPPAVEAARAQYRAESDVIGGFLSECILDPEARADRTVLYAAYTAYRERNGLRSTPSNIFYSELRERGFETLASSGTRYIVGIAEPEGHAF